MDGFKILISGFDNSEKADIEMIISQMGWQSTKIYSDVNIVVVKNVMAPKYKMAVNVLKKPIVTVAWLQKCWEEHRAVPHKPYRVLPFAGLTISVTKINIDERKDIEKIITQNGGKYSPQLTKMCTHLIANAPEGEKYTAARRWGNVHIVTRKWFDDSIIKKVCLNEENYPVHVAPLSSAKATASTHHKQESHMKKPQEPTLSTATVCPESDLEATLSQNMANMFSDPYKFSQEAHREIDDNDEKNEVNLENYVAKDSQSSDEDDLYLSECIIAIVGFEGDSLQKLVNMVRRGGGTQRPLSVSKLTHVIVGAPSEPEKKIVRNLAASGVINVVKSLWLEDCNRERKEVDALRRHTAYDLLIPKDSSLGVNCNSQSKICVESRPSINEEHMSIDNCDSFVSKEETPNIATAEGEKNVRSSVGQIAPTPDSTPVFGGKIFRFSEYFPEDRRGEIIDWISQGGGKTSNDSSNEFAHYIIDIHGLKTEAIQPTESIRVSTHWIKSCLEVGDLVDINSHVLYSPLPCSVPFPGFENLRFCTSQYDENERSLIRNLCFVLGAKLVNNLSRKVTHLLCKYATGPKYEAASRWGLCIVTCEWVFDCIHRKQISATEFFRPNPEIPAQFSTFTQIPLKKPRLSDDKPDEQLLGRNTFEKNVTNLL